MELKMSELIQKLNDATLAYDEGKPIMTDEEWDNLYFALQQAETQSGIRMPNSPTQKVVYQVVNSLNKVEHSHKMLSLDKTKSIDEVNSFLGKKPYLAMCKMDGLTCSLHYDETGRLVSAETRGNGIIGEDILHNAKVVANIPNRIATDKELTVDGEIICTYEDFKDFEEDYKNPRNFAAGSIRLLDSAECSKRNLSFIAWEVPYGLEQLIMLSDKLQALRVLGFDVVPYCHCESPADDGLVDAIKIFARKKSYPIDGVVFKFNDTVYGQSLGETAHHFKNAIAYKFYDDVYETTLKDIEWTMGRTGILTPVAVFEPVDIEGSIVERASLHNVSIMEDLLGSQPWIGEHIGVFKANMIIPQVQWAIQQMPEGEVTVMSPPDKCPICGGDLKINDNDGVKTLICTNSNCEGKLVNVLDHFCGKKGLDIKGLSKATLEKLIAWGWVNSRSDIFRLSSHKEEWEKQPGFGKKSVENVLSAIEQARNSSFEAFISSLGIPLIGKTVAKELVKYVSSYDDLKEKVDSHYDFSRIEGFASSKTEALWNYDYSDADKVYQEMCIETEEPAKVENPEVEQSLTDLHICITGKLNLYKNRDELVKEIESRGGKVTSAVTRATDILINNDSTSNSAKNTAAKKLGIYVLTEDEFKALYIDK